MPFLPNVPSFRRHPGSVLGAALSLLCLGSAQAVLPAPAVRVSGADPAPGARLNDDAVAVLPVAVRRLLADASWLGAVQHFGDRRLAGSSDFPRLGALIESALRLDPNFRPPAVAGALLLAEAPPLGAGEPRRADRILTGWVSRHPEDFEAVLVRALLHHWHLDDPEEGARILEAATAGGKAPPWLSALAARSLAAVGARDSARVLWRALLARAPDVRALANARTHLLQLDALDQLDRLASVVAEYERRRGRRPGGWDELVDARLLSAVPVDPAGVPFVLDDDGMPRIARASPLAGHPGR